MASYSQLFGLICVWCYHGKYLRICSSARSRERRIDNLLVLFLEIQTSSVAMAWVEEVRFSPSGRKARLCPGCYTVWTLHFMDSQIHSWAISSVVSLIDYWWGCSYSPRVCFPQWREQNCPLRENKTSYIDPEVLPFQLPCKGWQNSIERLFLSWFSNCNYLPPLPFSKTLTLFFTTQLEPYLC